MTQIHAEEVRDKDGKESSHRWTQINTDKNGKRMRSGLDQPRPPSYHFIFLYFPLDYFLSLSPSHLRSSASSADDLFVPNPTPSASDIDGGFWFRRSRSHGASGCLPRDRRRRRGSGGRCSRGVVRRRPG